MTAVSAPIDEPQRSVTSANQIYHVYPRRFAILIIFCFCSLSSGFQWIEYVIIQNIIVRYYNESLPEAIESKNNAVAWTSLLYMVSDTAKETGIVHRSTIDLGDVHSTDVSSHVAFGSLRNEDHLLYGRLSQCHRCFDQMRKCSSIAMVDRLQWTDCLCFCTIVYAWSVPTMRDETIEIVR